METNSENFVHPAEELLYKKTALCGI